MLSFKSRVPGHKICLNILVLQVYELVGQNWRDLGTAFCSGEYDETAREAQLVAKSEETQDILLQITVRVDDVYQRQAGTYFSHLLNMLREPIVL